MTQTTNYELNIVEGTDIVNPMSVDNPNYQTIDTVMYANECNSIGSATELKSGTVHALTRVKSNQGVFRFRATSRYVAGDTFSVDGASVTAQLPDGSALADGAYIIGSDVLCALIGTQLTLFVSINNAEQIMVDQNTSVADYLEDLNATQVEYDTSVTTKSAIDGVSALKINANTYSTWGAALSALGTSFDALTDAQKKRAYIVWNDRLVFSIQDMSNKVFTYVGVGYSATTVRTFSLVEGGIYLVASIGSSYSMNNYSSNSQGESIELFY